METWWLADPFGLVDSVDQFFRWRWFRSCVMGNLPLSLLIPDIADSSLESAETFGAHERDFKGREAIGYILHLSYTQGTSYGPIKEKCALV